jgi:inositol oxygenase
MNKKNTLIHTCCIFLLSSLNICANSLECSKNTKPTDEFRDYENNVPERVRDFYLLNHTHQTLNFVLAQKKKYYPLNKLRMSIWEAMEKLDAIVDESDPDLDSAQTVHAFQTAERLRKDGHPRWLILTGFIHDLGKVLILFGEPQWAVVGDTFPVGCAYSNKVIFFDYFTHNRDMNNRKLQTTYGMYQPHCGLDNVHMSWGHDEYLYQVTKKYLPDAASYIIRYHSFYAAHKDSAYDYLMDDYDRSMMKWLELFRNYDLYSKSPDPVNVSELMPYYQELVAEFFPEELKW